MIWIALALVAALGIFGPDCHQGATVFDGQTITPELSANCKF
jgi:hypothetical protein